MTNYQIRIEKAITHIKLFCTIKGWDKDEIIYITSTDYLDRTASVFRLGKYKEEVTINVLCDSDSTCIISSIKKY